MKAGAMLGQHARGVVDAGRSVPVEENPMGRVLVNGQRTLPHSIMVNKRGRRFTNEAANYNAFGGAFHVEDVSRFEYANLPCWLVFDQNYVDTYGFRVGAGGEATGCPMGAAGRHAGRAGRRARLAADGLDRHDRALERAVRRRPRPRLRARRQRLRPLVGRPVPEGQAGRDARRARRGPYYAVEIHSGPRHQGRTAGRRATAACRVDGEPIPGLYAAGNVMGSPFGMTYGGAGGTLGPAMVFGYLAARHASAGTCSGRRSGACRPRRDAHHRRGRLEKRPEPPLMLRP